jgi:hypothetical protein
MEAILTKTIWAFLVVGLLVAAGVFDLPRFREEVRAWNQNI